jgi:osmotically-inducible protein OsmY
MRATAWLLLISLVCFLPACTNDNHDESTTTSTPSTTPTTPPASTDADNTAKNAELNTATDTATAQGESAADREITAAIRKAVVDDNTLSVNAHNVKIITNNGVVTLRGPVKSESEKQTVAAKAKQVAGVTKVDNLLEVEKNP